MKTRSYQFAKGFTLLETLVALVVIAIAMAALWKGLVQGQAVASALPERTVARWVAQNRVITAQVMGMWPNPRVEEGQEMMGGREWYWQEQVSNTNDGNMKRITVSVGLDEGEYLYTLEGYLQRPTTSVPYEEVLFR